MFGFKKFHQYPFGRRFSLLADHWPINLLLGPKRDTFIPVLQRWAIQLSAHQYDLENWASNDNVNADALSQLLRKAVKEQDDWSTEAYQVNRVQMERVSVSVSNPRGHTWGSTRCTAFFMVGQRKISVEDLLQ